MKAYHYLISWLYTLIAGIPLNLLTTNSSETAFAFTAAAGVFSVPFIILFSIAMLLVLQMNPRKEMLHLFTFIIHAFGALLTYLIMTIIFDNMLPNQFPILVLGYFVLDSIFFHVFIEIKHSPNEVLEDEVLDSEL